MYEDEVLKYEKKPMIFLFFPIGMGKHAQWQQFEVLYADKLSLKSKNAYLFLICKKVLFFSKKFRTMDHIAAPGESNGNSIRLILHLSLYYPVSSKLYYFPHVIFV